MDRVVLDRALYKQIKAMDRDKMADFLSNIYLNGKNDVEAVSVDVYTSNYTHHTNPNLAEFNFHVIN